KIRRHPRDKREKERGGDEYASQQQQVPAASGIGFVPYPFVREGRRYPQTVERVRFHPAPHEWYRERDHQRPSRNEEQGQPKHEWSPRGKLLSSDTSPYELSSEIGNHGHRAEMNQPTQ